MRRLRRGTAALGVALVVAVVPSGAQDAETLRIDSVDVDDHPNVTAVVTAPALSDDRSFSEADFEVVEDGTTVEAVVERISTASLEVILVIDTSGSMDGAPMAAAKAAAGEFLQAMSPQVRVGAVSFGPAPTLLSAPITERQTVADSVAGVFASGETALYDAVGFAAGQFSDDASDRALLVLSDGGDTVSAGGLADAVDAIGDIRVDVIELATAESDRAALEQLVAAGGGAVASTADPDALGDLYRLVAATLVNQYRLTYESTANGEVDLTVRLTTADLGVLESSRTVRIPGDAGNGSSPSTTDTAAAGPDPAPKGSSDTASGVGTAVLALGAMAIFTALAAIGVIVTSSDGTRRRARASLGLHSARTIESGTAARFKDRMATDVDSFLERQGRKRSLEVALDVAGIALRPGEFIVLTCGAALIAALVGALLAGPVGGLVLLALVPLVARAVVSRKARKRRAAFADALPDNLQMLTSSLRSGYSLLQALDAVAQEATEPARYEFRRVILEIRVGRDPNEALRALAKRMESPDFDWVVGAIEINREVGGDLAVILDTVGGTIRERQQMARQIRALTAEGRMSVWILTGLPIVLAFILSAINPGYLDDLRTGAGLVMVVVGASLLVMGWVWMSRLIKIDY